MTTTPSQTPDNTIGTPLDAAKPAPMTAVSSAIAPTPPPALTTLTAPTVNLHIDRLVLHGFSTADRHRISAAMQTELARLLQEQGMPRSLQQDGVINQFNGGDFALSPGLPPHVIGTRIARSLYQELNHD